MAYLAPRPTSGKRCWITVRPGPPQGPWHIPGQNTFYFPLNPDIQFTRATRTQGTQTLQGTFIDNEGLGIGQLTLTGNTGWAGGGGAFNGRPVNGYEAYQALQYNIWNYYFALLSQEASQTPQVTMQFANDADETYYNIVPASTPNPPTWLQSKSKPYLYQFTLSFWVIADLNHPGAVSPIADPIDPLIHVTPGMAVSNTVISLVNVTPSPISQTLPGRVLRYTVQAGDTLDGIAARFGAKPATLTAAVNAIAAASQVVNPNLIWIGQVLTIPQPLP